MEALPGGTWTGLVIIDSGNQGPYLADTHQPKEQLPTHFTILQYALG